MNATAEMQWRSPVYRSVSSLSVASDFPEGPFLDSFLLADDTLSGVASEHGPVSFRTECLIPWTVGKSFGLELG